MATIDLKAHWQNRDDFRMSLIPKWLNRFWDFPRNRTYASLMRMVMNNRLARLNVFVGPKGAGKTITAYHLACVSSCESYDAETHAPCGECAVCQHVLYGKAEWRRGALLEIDAADKTNNGTSTVMQYINEAHSHTMAYRTAKPGDSAWQYVVFIDEAHRLTPTQLETLLKKSEQWVGAHLILATTRLDKLSVPGESDDGNPLLSRAEIFDFNYPTHNECVIGLINTAKTAGIEVEADVAGWMSNKHARCPRDILGELYRLSNHGDHITRHCVIEEYGSDAWDKWISPAMLGDMVHDDDDGEFPMVA